MWFIGRSILAYLTRDNLKQKEIEKLELINQNYIRKINSLPQNLLKK